MTRVQLVVSGVGGQGIVFLTRVIAEAAVAEGRNVLAAETHGMSQRGGAVISHIKMGEFQSSLVRRGRADAALVLDADRLEAARPLLREGGTCFLSATEAPVGVEVCNAGAVARELEHPRGENLVLLGFAVARSPDLFPSRDAIIEVLERISPPAARELNVKAFKGGADG
ncbi:MAG: 2-oxoacid:acceptor oxidoreductase family protein [Planctomycetota bacterium]|jgi:indolepyruvate ferredoxin oxidoreductase beta subunit